MKYFLRLVSATVAAGAAAILPPAFAAEHSSQFAAIFSDMPALLANSSAGYLGIGFRDIDADRAAALKLKEAAGVEVLTIDHDAPAGAVRLKIHDVVLQFNSQPIASAEQLRRMLRETPPGRAVTLVISRDGQQQNINVTLADHAELEKKTRDGLLLVPDPGDDKGQIVLASPNSSSRGNSFFGSVVFGNPSVGVQLDALGSQLADYFGVKDGQGLLVKHVAENSPAATAGLKAGDVVTKVNGQTMATLSEWTKSIHSNRGKEVQVTIFRNHKEQVLSMQDGDVKHKGELELPGVFLDENGQARLNADLAQLNDSDLFDPQQLNDALAKSSQALSTLDLDKLAGQARQAASQIDTQKLQEEIQRSMKNLQGFDVKKWQQQMKEFEENLQSQEMY